MARRWSQLPPSCRNSTAKVQLSFGIFAFVGPWDVKVHLIEDHLAEKGDLSKFELHFYVGRTDEGEIISKLRNMKPISKFANKAPHTKGPFFVVQERRRGRLICNLYTRNIDIFPY